MNKIITDAKTVIPSLDVFTLEEVEKIVKSTADLEKIGAYKIGFVLGLKFGLPTVVQSIRKYTQKPIIYDHQKAATDIPAMGKNFVKVCQDAGIDVVIFFPQAGPETQKIWTEEAFKQNMKIIIGGMMTHPQYKKSEGGYLEDEGILNIYKNAVKQGVNDFVVPGNKPEEIKKIKDLIEAAGGNPVFYSPGLVTQGGDITEAAVAAGDYWHAIVGRAIYQADDPREVAILQTQQL